MVIHYTIKPGTTLRIAGAAIELTPALVIYVGLKREPASRRNRGPRTPSFLMTIICILLSLAISGSAQTPTPTTANIIEAIQKGNYDEALRLSDGLLRADPKSPKLWTLRGLALERSDHPHEALKAYLEALKSAPNYLPALEGAAQLEYKAQSRDAIALLQRILAIQSADPTAHGMLGVFEYRDREYDKAAQDFAAAGDLARSEPSALMAYALSLAHLNREPEAIPLFKQLLELRPADPAPRYDLALLQWRVSAKDDALSTLQPLLDGQPPDSAAMRLAAEIHEANGETPQAIQLLRSAIIAHPDEPENYLDFATLSFAHGSYSVGIDIINSGLSRLANSAALYMARGVLYGQNGDYEKAMADFERAHSLDPANSMAASAEGIAQSQRHNSKEALANFRKQVREHPKDAFGYYLLAESLSWSGPDEGSSQPNVTEAISAAEKAKELDPHLVQDYDLLASLYLQNGQLQKAIDTCRAALKLSPKDQSALYTLILALRKTGPKDELKELVQKLTELRKEEQSENRQKQRYGMLVEQP